MRMKRTGGAAAGLIFMCVAAVTTLIGRSSTGLLINSGLFAAIAIGAAIYLRRGASSSFTRETAWCLLIMCGFMAVALALHVLV
jgi:hypothetical protein